MSADQMSNGAGELPTPANLEQYTLTGPVAVVQHLVSIVKSGHRVTVFSNKGKTFILTNFLAVDEARQMLVFDVSADVMANEQILESGRNIFVCSPEGVKTQFVTGAVRAVQFDGKPAFEVAIPDHLIKLQRREFFRIQVPAGQQARCLIADYETGPLHLGVFDISLGGVGLWVPDSHMPGFDVGWHYQKVVLRFRSIGELNLALEVRHRLYAHTADGHLLLRVGCAFLGMTPTTEMLLQRYVGFLERERRALAG